MPVPSASPESSPPTSKRGSTAAPLFCSLGPVGPLTPQVPRVSEPCSCFIDLNADLMLFCEFCNSKCVDPNGVIQILVESQRGIVFKKNMI